MGDAIYIQHDQELIRMELDAYNTEDDFQSLLESFPDLLAGEQRVVQIHVQAWVCAHKLFRY